MSEELVRLSKLMSERGICSRREADEFIQRGWVIVDGSPIRELGTKVRRDQHVELALHARNKQNDKATFLLYKPVGYVSGQPEKNYPPAAKLLLPENQMAGDLGEIRRQHFQGLAPAGRLDIDSRGLMVFTQDGRLAKLLTGNNGEIEKEYHVRVIGEIDSRRLQKLRHGLSLDDKPLLPADVSPLGEGRLRMILREGRHRQIRRMCEAVDLKVVGLMRVRIGKIKLGDLPEGRWRFLRAEESFV